MSCCWPNTQSRKGKIYNNPCVAGFQCPLLVCPLHDRLLHHPNQARWSSLQAHHQQQATITPLCYHGIDRPIDKKIELHFDLKYIEVHLETR